MSAERAAGELAAAGVPRLRARVASLDEGVGGDCGDDGERDEARADDREQPAPLSPGADPLAPQLLPGLPREDRRPEHVVEDLVARRRALHPVDAADDALAPERVEQPPELRRPRPPRTRRGRTARARPFAPTASRAAGRRAPPPPARRAATDRALPGRARGRPRALRRSRAASRGAARATPTPARAPTAARARAGGTAPRPRRRSRPRRAPPRRARPRP